MNIKLCPVCEAPLKDGTFEYEPEPDKSMRDRSILIAESLADKIEDLMDEFEPKAAVECISEFISDWRHNTHRVKGSREEFILLVERELSKLRSKKEEAEEAIAYWERALSDANLEKIHHESSTGGAC